MMKIMIWCIVVMLLLMPPAKGQNSDPCVNTVGIVMIPGSECGEFHACCSGRLYKTVMCLEGMALNGDSQRCTVETFKNCVAKITKPLECPNDLQLAYYPDYSEGCPTKTFIECKYGQKEVKHCQSGTSYDEGTDTCSSKVTSCGSDIPCDMSTTFAIYADYSYGCPPKGFLVCLTGTLFANTCPDGLFYNEGVKNCDFSHNIPCAQNVRPNSGI